jgi:hypothetical protein
MGFNKLWRSWFGRTRPFPLRVQQRCNSRRRPITRPRLEALEERTVARLDSLSSSADAGAGHSG